MIKMKKNVTRKQFEKAIATYQFKHLKFKYLQSKSTIKYKPAHRALEFVMPFIYNANIVIIEGATYIFLTCEGYFDLSDIYTSPDDEGVLFVIERNLTTDQFEKFFEKFIDSDKATKLMDEMMHEYRAKYSKEAA